MISQAFVVFLSVLGRGAVFRDEINYRAVKWKLIIRKLDRDSLYIKKLEISYRNCIEIADGLCIVSRDPVDLVEYRIFHERG